MYARHNFKRTENQNRLSRKNKCEKIETPQKPAMQGCIST